MTSTFVLFFSALLLPNHPMLIDIRSADQYEACHIPGSLNVQVFELKAKTYWRDQALLIVEAGHADLQKVLRELAEAGFRDVQPLEGGLYGHFLEGGSLAGSAVSPLNLAEIKPFELFAYRDNPAWELVDISDEGLAESDLALVAVQGPDLATKIQTLAHNHGDKRVVLIDRGGESSTAVLSLLVQLKDPHLFYLRGGLASYAYLLRNAQKSELRFSSKEPIRSEVAQNKSCGCKNK